jgi:predicted DNA-binding transcriptional regulator AlpA
MVRVPEFSDLELRDQSLTWTEVAKQVDMTVSGAWSRYRRARPPKPPRLGRWQQVVADALDQNLAIGVRAAVADHLGRSPTPAELIAAITQHFGAQQLVVADEAVPLHLLCPAGPAADHNVDRILGASRVEALHAARST